MIGGNLVELVDLTAEEQVQEAVAREEDDNKN